MSYITSVMDELLIDDDVSLRQAMQHIDRHGKNILFILGDDRVIRGVLTDGDIRRGILSGIKLEDSVREVVNYSPLCLIENESDRAEELIARYSIPAIPIINSQRQIVSIALRDSAGKANNKGEMNIPIVMMAGGEGTRLYPYTKILPKPLIPIADIPISERIIDSFLEYGCKDYFLIVNYKKNMIKAYYNDTNKSANITYIDEDVPLGTGGGISLLKGVIDKTFLLTNCDIIIDDDLSKAFEHHKSEGNVITMICSMKSFTIPYGVVNMGMNGIIESMEEKPSLSFFTNTGCYIMEPEVIKVIDDGEHIDVPDIITRLQDRGYKVGAYPIGEKAWMDMGQMDAFELMTNRLEGR